MKDKPKYAEGDIWTEDRVFGMQYLNGVNPMMIERCDSLPAGFPVTQDQVANLLDRGLTLEEEMKVSCHRAVNINRLAKVFSLSVIGPKTSVRSVNALKQSPRDPLLVQKTRP